MSLGERIQHVRKSFKLKQDQFADRIVISRSMVSQYETNLRFPSPAIIKNICREFNISEHWLTTGEGEMFLPEVKEKFNDLWNRKKEEYKIGDEAVTELLKVVPAETKIEIFEAIASLNTSLTLLEEGEDPEIVAEYISKISSLMRLLTSFLYRINEFSFDYITDDLNLEKFDLDYRDYEIRSKQIIMEIFSVLCGNVEDNKGEDNESMATVPTIKIENKVIDLTNLSKETPESFMMQTNSDYDFTFAAEPIGEYVSNKKIPIVGNVAAGNAIEIYNHVDDLIDVPGSMTVDYVLNVKGNSMEPLIADGSLIFVKQQDDLDQGNIGIFMIDDSKVTCKRYHRNNGNVVLRSENKDYPDMVFGPKSNIRILGKVVLTKND